MLFYWHLIRVYRPCPSVKSVVKTFAYFAWFAVPGPLCALCASARSSLHRFGQAEIRHCVRVASSFIRPSPRGGRSGIRPRLVQTAVSVVVHPGGMAGRRRLGRETKRAAGVFISARPIQVTRPRLRPSARGSWKWRACIAPVQRIRGRRSSSGSDCP